MKLVRIDPPGAWLIRESVRELVAMTGANTFLEVGVGDGELSSDLLKMGLTGIGIDLSEEAVRRASRKLARYIKVGQYQVTRQELSELPCHLQFDLAVSMMVIEHIPDDVGFVADLRRHVRSGGHVIVGAPARMDKWGIEDETVGHIRRYEREQMSRTLIKGGVEPLKIWSIGVPVANLLLSLSNMTINLSSESEKTRLSKFEQTATSGVRDIPFKTAFPSCFRLLLNRWTLWPLFTLQRLFYKSKVGLVIVCLGRVN